MLYLDYGTILLDIIYLIIVIAFYYDNEDIRIVLKTV